MALQRLLSYCNYLRKIEHPNSNHLDVGLNISNSYIPRRILNIGSKLLLLLKNDYLVQERIYIYSVAIVQTQNSILNRKN